VIDPERVDRFFTNRLTLGAFPAVDSSPILTISWAIVQHFMVALLCPSPKVYCPGIRALGIEELPKGVIAEESGTPVRKHVWVQRETVRSETLKPSLRSSP
jgi:hypothetical protein